MSMELWEFLQNFMQRNAKRGWKTFSYGQALQKMYSEFVRNDEFVKTMRKFSVKYCKICRNVLL